MKGYIRGKGILVGTFDESDSKNDRDKDKCLN